MTCHKQCDVTVASTITDFSVDIYGWVHISRYACMCRVILYSRFITFEDFSTLLAQSMGKNWLCPQEELHAVTLKLAQVAAEEEEEGEG